MAWRMPHEGDPHERTWMAFPNEGPTLGDDPAEQERFYAAWSAVASEGLICAAFKYGSSASRYFCAL